MSGSSKQRWPKALPELPDLHKLIFDLSSSGYHGLAGTYSSTQFKDMLDDEEIFIKKYIEKVIPREEVPAFSTGTYFHTGTLEPHKLKEDCIIYPKKVRRGEFWESFKQKHADKAILTPAQKEQAERLINAVRDSPVAMSYIKRGRAEVSLFNELAIYQGDVYAPKYGKRLSLREGWIDDELSKEELKKSVKLIIKVRADSLGEEFILDLKSTTGNARSPKEMSDKISYYQYDLSASLYLDMFSLAQPLVSKFLWTFASKDRHNCKTWEASPQNILVGRAKWMKAIISLATCMKNEWQLFDELGVLEPKHWELEIIKESDANLL